MKTRETAEIEKRLIQNQQALYEGRYAVKEEIHRNLEEYFGEGLRHRLGIEIYILVKTPDDRILYPSQPRRGAQGPVDDFTTFPSESIDYMETAAENFRILSLGLVLTVNIRVRPNSWISNAILIFYILSALLVLMGFVRRGIREAESREIEREGLVADLAEQLARAESRLQEVGSKEDAYQKRISELRDEKSELSRDIDGLLEDMERQETGLQEQRGLREALEHQVLQLRQEITELKEKTRKPRQKKREDAAAKRFKVLYKNLAFTERAVEGFLHLTEEFQLKAEEVIHNLNQNESLVVVKRKVFGKGGKMNVLEVEFSYAGRIYLQKDTQSKTRIVAIGTKNTQEKDLAFLEGLR